MRIHYSALLVIGSLTFGLSLSHAKPASKSSVPLTQANPAAIKKEPTSPTQVVVGNNLTFTSTGLTFWDKVNERAVLTYLGIYRGAPLSDLGNSLQPTPEGTLDDTSPQSFENYLTVGYKLRKDLTLGVSTHFFYYPIGNPAGSGRSMQWYDPSIVFTKNGFIDTGNFKLTARVSVQLPFSASDILQRQNLAFAVLPTLIGNYDVPNTKLSVGFFSYFAAYIPTADTIPGARTVKLIFAPTANYQISKTVAATLWVDLIQTVRAQGTGFFSGMTNFPIDIEPGISWDVSKYITINPILNIYPAKPTLAATSLQALIIAHAF